MDITKTKADIKNLEGLLETLKGQLKADHPNHCTSCGGVGGVVGSSGDGWNEPLVDDWDDCRACLDQSLNPLDITQTISDEDAESHVEMMMEGTKNSHILSKINEVELKLHCAYDYLAHLEMEEAERECLEREHEQAMREAAEDEKSYEEFYSDYN